MKQKVLFLSVVIFAVLSVVLGAHGTVAALSRQPVEMGWFLFLSVGIMLILLCLYRRQRREDSEPAG